MAHLPTLEALETSDLIIQVDAGRTAGDRFKFSADFMTEHKQRHNDARDAYAAAEMADADTTGASVKNHEAIEELIELLRNGYSGIKAVPSRLLSAGDRARVYAAYGWEGGKIGELTSNSRVEAPAARAAAATADATLPAEGKYSATLAGLIADALSRANVAKILATGGTRQAIIQLRNERTELLQKSIARARFLTCGASDDLDQTLELAKYGMQPRRDRGEAQAYPHPDAAGPATFHPATRMLSVAAMPTHATSLRAYRQPAGGQPELAGVSSTVQVSVASFSPLTAGVTYEFWVVGKNSQGEGPASPRVSFHA